MKHLRLALLSGLALFAASAALATDMAPPVVHRTMNHKGVVTLPAERAGAGVFAFNGITYHGGPLLNNPAGVNVYVIWYGNWTGNTATTIIPQFLAQIGGSAYFNINTTYTDSSGVPVPNKVNYKGSTTDAYSQGNNLSDAQVQAVVNSAIASGRLPKDTNGFYAVLTSSDVAEGGTGFCASYCGWHTHAGIQGADIKFAFIGDPRHCAGSCGGTGTTPNGNSSADNMVSVIAHELEETATDPDLSGWYDIVNGGYSENADKCAWNFGTTSTAPNGSAYNVHWGSSYYLIQQNWLNANGGGCAISYAAPPPPTSTLSSNPASVYFGSVYPTYVTSTLQITNTASTTATGLTYSNTGSSTPPTGTCGATLAPHATCSLTFTDSAIPYSCTSDMPFRGTVNINGSNINIPLVVPFSGIASEPSNWCH
jgi:hypothetical protein